MGASALELREIRIPENAAKPEVFAAEELRDALLKISGRKLEIIRSDEVPAGSGGAAILGTPDSSPAIRKHVELLRTGEVSATSDAVSIRAIDGNLYLAGSIPRGVLFAVYHYLQQELGVRWFWPGSDGELMPKRDRIEFSADLNIRYASPFPYRAMSLCVIGREPVTELWLIRNFINVNIPTVELAEKSGAIRRGGGHSVAIYDKTVWDKHPEYYAMVDGRRDREKGFAGCWSNPGFHQYMIEKHLKEIDERKIDLFGLYPADTAYHCECENCLAIDRDPSTKWFKYFDKLAGDLKKLRPHVEFSSIAYMYFREVPETTVKNAAFIEYCQWELCMIHDMKNSDCLINQASRSVIERWKKVGKTGVYGYEYDVFLKSGEFMPVWKQVAANTRAYRDLGMMYIKTELPLEKKLPEQRSKQSIHRKRISLYMFPQSYWNPELDEKVVFGEWCDFAYGAASPVMQRYHEAVGRAWASVENTHLYPYPFGTSPNGIAHKFITPELALKVNELFCQAEQLAKGNINVQVDRELFGEWLGHYDKSMTQDAVRIPRANSFANAVELPVFYGGGKIYPTTIKMYWNGDSLYLKFICVEPDMAAIDRNAKGPWSIPQGVELFLGDGRGFCQFAVSAADGVYTARGWDVGGYQPKWTRKITYRADRWELEVAIPFSEIDVKDPKPGKKLFVRLMRDMAAPGARAGFPRLKSNSYHDMTTLGVLQLGEDEIK